MTNHTATLTGAATLKETAGSTILAAPADLVVGTIPGTLSVSTQLVATAIPDEGAIYHYNGTVVNSTNSDLSSALSSKAEIVLIAGGVVMALLCGAAGYFYKKSLNAPPVHPDGDCDSTNPNEGISGTSRDVEKGDNDLGYVT